MFGGLFPQVRVGLRLTEQTLQLVGQILTMQNRNLSLEQLIVATPNATLAKRLDGPDHRLTIILEKKREGKTSALRKILRQATGDILVLASSDIKLGIHSIASLVNALAAHQRSFEPSRRRARGEDLADFGRPDVGADDDALAFVKPG